MLRTIALCVLGAITPATTVAAAPLAQPRMVWQTAPVFQTPEAVLYDAQRDVLYVGNYRKTDPNEPSEFLSRVSTAGKVLTLKWVTGLDRPTGMAIHKDKLYVVERGRLARINIDTARIEHRYPIPGADFSNDVAFDPSGIAYISDNGEQARTAIFRLQNDRITPWMTSQQILSPNGLLVDGKVLIALVRIDRTDKTMTEIARFSSNARAIGDGIVPIAKHTYLVTAWSGESWIVSPEGTVTPLLDTNTLKPVVGERVNHADVGYVPQKKLWIIPTFFDNRLLAYQWTKP
jgi:DNA-binding beta-propeller fold protein YncE